MLNKRYGSLTVVRKLGPDPKWRMSQWQCVCDCGHTVTRTGRQLLHSKHPSCGCVHPVTVRNTFRRYGTVEDCLRNTARVGDCMEWKGHRTDAGYAQLGAYKGKHTTSLPGLGHRRVFFLLHGYLPKVVMHDCDNPPCINPEHLVAGDKKANSMDAARKGRLNQAKRKYKVLLDGLPVTLAEYSSRTGVPMATLQWRARHGKLSLLDKNNW